MSPEQNTQHSPPPRQACASAPCGRRIRKSFLSFTLAIAVAGLALFGPERTFALDATQAAQILTSSPWSWFAPGDERRAATLTFNADGTVFYTSGSSTAHLTWHWKITGPTSLHIDSKGGFFDLNFDNQWVSYTGHGVVNGEPRDKQGRRLEVPANPAAPRVAVTKTPAVNGGAPKNLEHVLLGYKWSWQDAKGDQPPITVQFFPDGRVSGGWHWQWLGKPSGEVIVDCFWGSDSHMYLAFNADLTEFGAYGGGGAKGKRLEAVGGPVSDSQVAVTSQSAGSETVTGNSSTVAPPPTGNIPWIASFAAEMNGADEWVSVPYQQPVPATIRNLVTAMTAGLKAEASKTPQATPAAYTSALKICQLFTTSLDDREATITQEKLHGGNANPLWVDPFIARQQQNRAQVRSEYDHFVEAIIKSGKPASPIEEGMGATVVFPPVPPPPAQPGKTQAPADKSNSGKGPKSAAFDHRYIWRGWWGPIYYRR